MRMKKSLFFLLILATTLCLALLAHGLGGDVDYDSGSSWDSSSDWDSGSSWDSGGSWSGSSGGGIYVNDDPFAWVLVFGFAAFFLYVLFKGKKTKNASQQRRSAGGTGATPKAVRPETLEELRKRDPAFSAGDVESRVKHWVMLFEDAWSEGDMTPCRPFIDDALFETYQRQLATLKSRNHRSVTEDHAVVACEVESWALDGDREILNVWMQTKKKTYIIDHQSRRVVRGNRDSTYRLEYRWQLSRPALSGDHYGDEIVTCESCGASTNLDAAENRQCPYCGSPLASVRVRTGEAGGWVLCKVDKISQSS